MKLLIEETGAVDLAAQILGEPLATSRITYVEAGAALAAAVRIRRIEYVPDIAPRAGEPVVEKHSHDSFNGTRLVSVFEELGIKPGARHTVLVAGVATHICVACGVVGLSVRNYQPVLVADCSASKTERQEELAYQLFSESAYTYNVRLSTSDRLKFALAAVHA